MKPRTFQAASMAEALVMVRRELGRDAVILNTRNFKTGTIFGLGGRNMVEITASADVNVLHPAKKRELLNQQAQQGLCENRINAPATATASQFTQPQATTFQDAQLKEELTLVKQMVSELVAEQRKQQHPKVPEELFSMYLSLINQDVAQEVADSIIEKVRKDLKSDQLGNVDLVKKAIFKSIEKMLPKDGPITVGRPGKPKVIAFIGPTGVGKTTTIAKLAANFKLREGKSVGLITIDTYRIAAVDQLRTYASIINIPLRVVLSPEELRNAVAEMRDKELILIDTAGRSQNDKVKLQELKSFLKAAGTDEVHLVLSSTSSQANLQANIDQFSGLDVDKVIFTKLDEAVGVGMLLNVISRLNRSVSYLATGQNVPDDIEPGNSRNLAKLLLDQCAQAQEKDAADKKAAQKPAVKRKTGTSKTQQECHANVR